MTDGPLPWDRYGNPKSHQWFEQWEEKGDYTMRYFIEPVALVAAYAKKLGYKHVVMLGLSGGGWTTTVAASVVSPQAIRRCV